VGRLVGELLHVPSAAHRWGVDPTSGPFEERSAELFAPLCARHGLPGLPKPRVILDPCPPDIQALDAEPGHPMRYIPFNGTGVLPEWVSGRANRRVAVSMGGTTLTLAGPSSFQRVIEALGGVPDIEVVVALSAQDLDLVGGLPDEFRVTEWLPLNLFVQTCDLLIHHGGSGTGLTAAAYGVPQLVLPQFADAFDYGRGIAACGAGVTVPDAAGQSDIDGLSKTITALLDDAGYRDSATALRERMRAAPSLASVVAMLTELEI
jgi:UDP:flavonoid glycosyltransferase YjiC (YdhE family)